MKNKLLITFLLIISFSSAIAQGFGYDSKEDLGHGLYKVRSGDYYGIIDVDDNVVVSIEYQNITFKDGKALLTKKDVLLGLVDSIGNVKTFSGIYKIHPYYRYIYEGYIIVSLSDELTYPNKWGYVDENERPLRMQQKVKGSRSILPNKPTMFDDVRPFVEGCASVFLNKYGWKHVDKYGREHYTLGDINTKALFRSSIHDGECIIVTNKGIKLYQESKDFKAVVKRMLSETVTMPRLNYSEWSCNEGVISLDSLMRAYKYENQTDSIVFFENVTNVKSTLLVKDALDVKLVYKNIKVNEKGKAYTEIELVNASDEKIEQLHVTLECLDAKRELDVDLDVNSKKRVSFNIPVRFSESSISKNITVNVSYKGECLEYVFPVTIRRYTPDRS